MTSRVVRSWILFAVLLAAVYAGFHLWRVQHPAQAVRPGTETTAAASVIWPRGPVHPFELVERSGEPFRSEDLADKVWLTSFFFCSCPSACTILHHALAQLEQELGEKDVTLVSITVDPENDTPERLRAYADVLAADPDKWLFLTGDKAEIERISVEEFELAFAKAAHSMRSLLVDGEGMIVGSYNVTDTADKTALLRRIDELLEGSP